MTFADQLPVLLVITPLLAGLVCSFLKGGEKAWWLTLATAWSVFAMALALLVRVHGSDVGFESYPLGGWAAPIGIEYRVDRLNGWVLTIVAGIGALVTLFARKSVASEVPADRVHFFYAAFLVCLTGLLGITITGDAFNVYVLLEISSLSTYALVAMGMKRDRRALTASINYLVMGTVGASFILLGIGYLFQATGTLNMADMAAKLSTLEGSDRTVRTAYAMLFAGFSIKMALFPLHYWLPNAYTYAPSAVTAFLASTATKVGVYSALRFLYTLFGGSLTIQELPADWALIGFGCVAILFGSLIAIHQRDMKKLLAFSSVAQIGYMAVGIGLANLNGLTGTLVHLLNHALVKGALFVGAGILVYRFGSSRMTSLQGLGKRMPLTAAAITLAGLGLIGVPLTGGFVSKWFLVSGALAKGLWPVAAVILLGSVLAVVY
ncbi:monovalent cation/H+ antiporter subunit D family protein, partial [Planctomycetota bacterium]|nr:monovalent cation/H+ antiporter subunit D family protein [Planctomycetota bacterium]